MRWMKRSFINWGTSNSFDAEKRKWWSRESMNYLFNEKGKKRCDEVSFERHALTQWRLHTDTPSPTDTLINNKQSNSMSIHPKLKIFRSKNVLHILTSPTVSSASATNVCARASLNTKIWKLYIFSVLILKLTATRTKFNSYMFTLPYFVIEFFGIFFFFCSFIELVFVRDFMFVVVAVDSFVRKKKQWRETM